MERTTLHIVCGDSRSRAEQARIAFALGHHAEVYAELDELLARPPGEGIVIATDDSVGGTTPRVIERCSEYGVWLPLVIAASEPQTEQVVAAIKAGALDFLRLPLEMGSFARRLAAIQGEAAEYAARRRRQVEARQAVLLLSRREREVLELLSAGCSNKEIARQLGISPRTVEIHRGNMMTKLRAGHPADAVRLWLEAQVEPRLDPGDRQVVPIGHDRLAGRIGVREIAEWRGRRQRQ